MQKLSCHSVIAVPLVVALHADCYRATIVDHLLSYFDGEMSESRTFSAIIKRKRSIQH
jgi:hypothetical protein